MKISIIIPTYQRTAQLNILLQSLVKYKTNLLHEVIVVSNDVNKENRNLMKLFHSSLYIKYYETNEVGVNIARNHGLQKCHKESEYVLFLDDDCEIIDPNFFLKIESNISNKEYDVFGGFYLLRNPSIFGYVYFLKKKSWLEYYTNKDQAYRVLGGLMLIKKSVFDKFSFDEKIKFGGSETELIVRLLDAKLRITLLTKWNILHNYDISFWQFCNKVFRQGLQNHRMKKESHPLILDKKFDSIYKGNLAELKLSFIKNFCVFMATFVHSLVFSSAKLLKTNSDSTL